MPSCEKCWSAARRSVHVADEYARLLEKRDATKSVCTPEEQAGPAATICPECGRRTVHQHCGVCMSCGYDSQPDWRGIKGHR